jgi:arsenate reductase
MVLWHNPRCRKSREALSLLQERGLEPEIRLYLEQKPSAAELKTLLDQLGMDAEALVRKGEAIYKAEYKGQALSAAAWRKAMAEHPKLIERPILVDKGKAVVGRPPERILELL